MFLYDERNSTIKSGSLSTSSNHFFKSMKSLAEVDSTELEYRFKKTEAQYHCLIFPLTSTLFNKLEFSTYFLMAERAGIIEGYGTNSGLIAPKSLGFFSTLIVRSIALTASCHLFV